MARRSPPPVTSLDGSTGAARHAAPTCHGFGVPPRRVRAAQSKPASATRGWRARLPGVCAKLHGELGRRAAEPHHQVSVIVVGTGAEAIAAFRSAAARIVQQEGAAL